MKCTKHLRENSVHTFVPYITIYHACTNAKAIKFFNIYN